MKKAFLMAAVMLMAGCGFMKNSTSSNTTTTAQPAATTTTTTTQNSNAAMSAGQGAGNALMNLYNQYKADGNKYDYKNMQNALNTVTLIANCEGLKDNFKNTTYLKEFGKGLVASSLGLVTQDNVEQVTNSLVDMVKNSETVQNAAQTAQSTANTAAGYANTAAQYAGAISSLLSAFGGK
ncbi:MAG: hypothetical protein J5704_05285 [Paludibacteraceae bacterium]|nr:hypothetical protein [Paludibacteraceae bacterium]